MSIGAVSALAYSPVHGEPSASPYQSDFLLACS